MNKVEVVKDGDGVVEDGPECQFICIDFDTTNIESHGDSFVNRIRIIETGEEIWAHVSDKENFGIRLDKNKTYSFSEYSVLEWKGFEYTFVCTDFTLAENRHCHFFVNRIRIIETGEEIWAHVSEKKKSGFRLDENKIYYSPEYSVSEWKGFMFPSFNSRKEKFSVWQSIKWIWEWSKAI